MMNDRTRTSLSRTARIAAGSLFALAALGPSAASTLAAPGGAGFIWTTDDACTAPAAQNQNLYAVGETVYVRGENFAAGVDLAWTIAGLPGGASADPGTNVASGTVPPLADGTFCLNAYTVSDGDWGTYTVDVTQGRVHKNDNYRVSGSGTTDPGTTDPGATDPGATETGDSGSTGGTNESSTGDSGSTGGTNESSPGDIGSTGGTNESSPDPDPGTTPARFVLGVTDTNPTIELPATDTLAATAGPVAPTILIAGLAAIAGMAVLFAPSRRRKADQPE